MKKITTIMLALMMVLFTQCKKENINDTDTNTDVKKVRIKCEIPMGGDKGEKSDFTNLLTDGSIKWSAGTERIYLAVNHETKAQIVELSTDNPLESNILAFEGEVDETILVDGETYEVWYFGNSHTLGGTSYVSTTESAGMITKIDGSIANQSGSLSDLGYYHIAKAEVTATLESDGSFTLPLNGTLKNQMAIAYMDLSETTELKGSAIIGTDYSLEYTDGEYKFIVDNETSVINIEGENENLSESFVVLLPNANDNVDIENDNWEKYTFRDGIVASNFYYKYISEVSIGTLKWEDNSIINGNAFVDLGLPSGLFWATCNVGASSPEEAGSLYAWGESETKYEYTLENSYTYGKYFNDISGNTKLDAATVNFGSEWRMPKQSEFNELFEYCGWELTSQNGVEGYKFIGTNGNHIFLPTCTIWTSTPSDGTNEYAYYVNLNGGVTYHSLESRHNGFSIRPVSGGGFETPEYQYAFVTTNEISNVGQNTAICGGNVINDNGFEITERGVCWSTSPDIDELYFSDNTYTNDGAGTGTYTSYITGLRSNTTYYVWAYVRSECGLVTYGERTEFTTLSQSADGQINGYDYIDLGLPSGLKWATYNVGATSPEGYGNYYAWGMTTTFAHGEYTEDNCATDGVELGNIAGKPEYDAATASWGSTWKMPTWDQMLELMNNCETEWVTISGVNGIKFTGPNGRYIFLPAAGYSDGSLGLSNAGYVGQYWSSTPAYTYNYPNPPSEYTYTAETIYLNSGGAMNDGGSRYMGLTIRAVSE